MKGRNRERQMWTKQVKKKENMNEWNEGSKEGRKTWTNEKKKVKIRKEMN